MTERSIAHGSFTVTRQYPHAPSKVFACWADPAIKRKWYGGPENDGGIFEFRNGGREFNGGKGPNGEAFGIDIQGFPGGGHLRLADLVGGGGGTGGRTDPLVFPRSPQADSMRAHSMSDRKSKVGNRRAQFGRSARTAGALPARGIMPCHAASRTRRPRPVAGWVVAGFCGETAGRSDPPCRGVASPENSPRNRRIASNRAGC
jgi:hypothetical protein